MTVVKTAKVGGTDILVGRVGQGLMMMTLRDPNFLLSDEECFEAIKAGVDAMPAGVKMLLNSGEFYCYDLGPGNLELHGRFFAKYPEYAERVFLAVKGGTGARSLVPDGSPENLRRSVETINKALGGTKKMDLFETARVPPNVSLEDAMKTLVELKNEGHFTYIGMSECSADTLKKAHAIHPISFVEIEVSVASYEEETKKVIAAAQELGITVAAYSPLGRGFLTGAIKSTKDLAPNEVRHRLSRYQEEALQHNLALTDAMKSIAEKKGISVGQLALAWVISRGPHVVPIPGSSSKTRNLENIAAGDIELSAAEIDEIDELMAKTVIMGSRYNDNADPKAMRLWA